jgi:hypothetical protein
MLHAMLPGVRIICWEFSVTKHGQVDDNNKFIKKIMFSDESVFHILGKIMYAFEDENILMLQHSTLDI